MPSVALTLLCAVAVASDAGGNGGTSPGLRGASLPVNESMQDKRENEEGGTCCFSGEDKDICATCYPMSIASYKSKCSKKNECDLNGVGSVFFPSVFCLNLGSLCGVCFKVGIVVAFGVHRNVSLELLMHPISVALLTLLEFPVPASGPVKCSFFLDIFAP